MNKNKERLIKFIYIIISFGLLILGYLYEQPFAARKIIIITLIIVYFLLSVLQNQIYQKKLQYILTIILICILIIIEFNSKYAINYFFHSIYIIMLMYVVIFYSKKPGFIFSGLLQIAATMKFIELLLIQPSSANIAVVLFFSIVQMLVLLVVIFAKIYKEESYKTKLLYEELLKTHRQLILYSNEIKQLTMMEERTKIARDLHDTLGHDMTGLIMQIEMASRYILDNHYEQGITTLEDAKISARESLTKVRQILNTLKNENDMKLINDSMKAMVEEFAKKTNIKIDLNIKGNKNINPDIEITLYRIIQESLTNSVRHGNADEVIIDLDYQDKYVSFCIKDNGAGTKEIIKGNGLNGIMERVDALKGEVTFESNSNFITKGRLPYEQGGIE